MAKFFIDHPRFAAVISIIITIVGLIAVYVLPISQYPEIAPPEIAVNANFPGASAETVRDTVGAVLEREVNGVENMIYMKSTSANDGSYALKVTFKVGADADKAQTLVQNRVNKAMPNLPEDVRRRGIKVEKESSAILQIVTLQATEQDSPYDDLFLSNYATLNIKDALLRVPGVGKVKVLNQLDYSARIWLNPLQMNARGITAQDVVAAIREQNIVAAAGQIGALPTRGDQQFTYTLQTKGRMVSPEEFSDIILRADPDGAVLYLSDVARLELGAEMYLAKGKFEKRGSAVIAIYQQPGANALAVGAGIRAQMTDQMDSFPSGIEFSIPYDSTKFVEISIDEVYETLLIAVVLVVAVTFMFLQTFAATVIPSLAIPVSLIGTFACMLVLGYSVNLITLFGLILSIGITVDAAIIVLENVERIIHQGGSSVRDAAIRAMGEVTGPLVASALVLLAVFVPVSLMPGLTGIIFKQFGVVLSISVVLSTIVALSLTPALCVLMMKDTPPKVIAPLRAFNRLVDWTTGGYVNLADKFARRTPLTIVVYGGLLAAIYGLASSIPTGFIPQEDQGAFFVEVQLPEAASINRTDQVLDRMVDAVNEIDGVRDVVSVAGFSLLENASATNAGILVVNLQDWEERTAPGMRQKDIFFKTAARLAEFDDAISLPFESPAIPGLGNSAGFEFILQDLQGRSPQVMADALETVLAEIEKRPEIGAGFSTFRASVPQIFLDIDRLKAKNEGVRLDDLFTTLQAQLGGFYVNDITMFGRRTPVMVQAESEFRDDPDDLLNVYVRNSFGNLVPVSTLVTPKDILGPQTLTRYNLFNAIAISGEAAQGYSSGDAVRAMQEIAETALPQGFGYEWTGSTYQEISAGSSAGIAFGMAMLFAFLFLVAQYESWMVPASILLVVPTALIGAFLHTLLAGGNVNIYTQIGLILMVGMAARNAILIVEFAKQLNEDGMDLYESASTAARLRFRPLLMTAFSFLFGVIPLVIATGAGDGSRRALGQAVFGGMTTAVIVGAVLTPAVFVLIMRLRAKLRKPAKP
jgi:HAE1 family hydrophobic/amphiphilic exporter-1